MNQHVFEFWPHLSGKQPREVAVSIEDVVHSLNAEFPEMPHKEIAILEPYLEDIEAVWQQGIAANPRKTSQLKPIVKGISPDGSHIYTALSTYKLSYWMKLKLSTLPFEVQRQLANQFCILNIGAVTVTREGYILLEQRPENVTAGGMLLSYPCGYLTRSDKTLEDPVNAQSVGELGFPLVRNGVLDTQVQNITAIGMQRESDEWSTNYVFIVQLDIPFSGVRPTKETKTIIGWPKDEIVERAVAAYSPSIKGSTKGRLVPNTVGMLGLYILAQQGRTQFDAFMGKIREEGRTRGYAVQITEYTATTCPFKQSS